jgi:hypothetical protein
MDVTVGFRRSERSRNNLGKDSNCSGRMFYGREKRISAGLYRVIVLCFACRAEKSWARTVSCRDNLKHETRASCFMSAAVPHWDTVGHDLCRVVFKVISTLCRSNFAWARTPCPNPMPMWIGSR